MLHPHVNRILPAAGVRRNHLADSSTRRTTYEVQDIDEDASVNRLRREVSEGSTAVLPNRALLRCRKPVIMASFNANTARTDEDAIEIAYCAESCGIDILGIQEHRRVHDEDQKEDIKFEKVESYHLLTSSAWRNESQASQGGVGLLLSNKAKRALRSIESISERILLAEFESNPVTTVIVAYSPINTSAVEKAESFYDTLKSVIRDVPAHNFLVVLGDFNARLGRDNVPYSFHENTNRNGGFLAELLIENELLASNTQFKKRPGKMWTFRDRATGDLRQLDYVLVRKKWRNSILNAEAYNTFSSASSDHRVVSAKIRLSLRISKSPQRNHLDWIEFSQRRDLQDQYSIHIQNQFSLLNEENQTMKYEKFIEMNNVAKKKFVPLKKKRRRDLISQHPDIQRARLKLKNADMELQLHQSHDNEDSKKIAKEELKTTYKRLREEEVTKLARKIEAEYGGRRYGAAWKVINEITGRKRSKEGLVKGKTPQERVDAWFSHYHSLLGTAPVVDDPDEVIPTVFSNLDISEEPFTPAEYAKVKAGLKRGQSGGPDEIPPDVFINCDVDNEILELCNTALMSSEKPDQWSYSHIVPIPKSGNLSKPQNTRGISQSCTIAKIYNKMILNRIRPAIDPLLRTNQNGFRSGRNTVGQILAVRRIIEEAKAHNLPAIMTFIDFKKAFDSIHRDKMFRILNAYGIPPRLLGAIRSMYKDTFARVLSPDGETAWFEILAGVLQGDTLAPFLFIIVLDYALRKAISGREGELGFTITPRRSRRHQAVVQTDLDFADDIALLSNDISQAQELLNQVQAESKKIGLVLNSDKTKFIALNSPTNVQLHGEENEEIEKVDDFKYLGSYVMSTAKDVKIRKAKAWKALNDMNTIWKSDISREIKERFFIATVESILLYGSEAWTLTPAMVKSLDGCYTRMLRAAFNVSWRDHLTNVDLYQTIPQVSEKVTSRRLQLAGHCFRHPELPAHEVLLWQPKHGNRGRGRPAMTYPRMLLRDAGVESTEELCTLLGDRRLWSSISGARPWPPE